MQIAVVPQCLPRKWRTEPTQLRVWSTRTVCGQRKLLLLQQRW